MTSTVTIEAHCSDDTVVFVAVANGWKNEEEFTLNDGETAIRNVYDEREITVIEIPRPTEPR